MNANNHSNNEPKYGNLQDKRTNALNHTVTMDDPHSKMNSYDSVEVFHELKIVIEQSINDLNLSTACFLAELLFSITNDLPISNISRIETIYLYSLALYLNNDYITAFEITSKFKSGHIILTYLHARCALKLNKNEENACLYLTKKLNEYDSFAANHQFLMMPSLATIHCVIGQLNDNIYNSKACINHYLEALKMNPYIWEIYSTLLKKDIFVDLKQLILGVKHPNNNICNRNNDNMNGSNNQDGKIVKKKAQPDSNITSISNKFSNKLTSPIRFGNNFYNNKINSNNHINNKNNNNANATNNTDTSGITKTGNGKNGGSGGFSISKLIHHSEEKLSPSKNTARNLLINNPTSPTLNGNTVGTFKKNGTQNNDNNGINSYHQMISTPSKNLPNNESNNQYGNGKISSFKSPRTMINSNRIGNTMRRKNSGSNGNNMHNFANHNITNSNIHPMNKSKISGATRVNMAFNKSQLNLFDESSILSKSVNRLRSESDQLNMLFYTFVKVLKLTVQFNCHNAIRVINAQIPKTITDNMPWCQAQLGKLHYEISNYDMSYKYFENLRKLQRTRINDLEIFSTLLWHLKDSYGLYNLSDELFSEFPNAPETWCVTGNYYSLVKKHDEAINSFKKATLLNPKFEYAYTLQAHEYAANESFDTAKEYYRKALACDPQHYNAYYGLGDCALRLGKYEEAILYFEKARTINPTNVILICCCAHVLEKISMQEKALEYYNLACKLQPDLTLPKYKKSQLLFSMGRYSLALQYFEELVKIIPDEATIHFMLGQIYQTMGRKKDAIKEYTIALNLDPLGNQVIIDALEKCHLQE